MTKDILDQVINLVKDLLRSLFAVHQTEQPKIGELLKQLEYTKNTIDELQMQELAGLSRELEHLHQYFTKEGKTDKIRVLLGNLVSNTCFMIEEANIQIARQEELEEIEKLGKIRIRYTDLDLDLDLDLEDLEVE